MVQSTNDKTDHQPLWVSYLLLEGIDWKVTENEKALKEGWCLKRYYNGRHNHVYLELGATGPIRRTPNGTHRTHSEAFDWVSAQADQGSEFHARAIRAVVASKMKAGV